MSVAGDAMDRVATLAAGAVVGLQTSRKSDFSKTLATDEMPHLFIFLADPFETSAREDWGQDAVSLELTFVLVSRDDQETILGKSDAIVDAIRADWPLNSLGIEARVTLRGMIEDPQQSTRAVRHVLTLERFG